MPIDDVEAHGERLLDQLRETGRPIVLTGAGRAVGVLVSPEDFDRLTAGATEAERLPRPCA